MDTESNQSEPDPKSWDDLISEAKQASPPDDLKILDGVKRAIANEEAPAPAPTGWVSTWLTEIAALPDFKWATAGLGFAAVCVVVFSWVAAGAWQEMTFALNLQLPVWPDVAP